MDRCPYCGSDTGVYTTFIAYQQYSWTGQPRGYSDGEHESKYARCDNCDRRISMKRILKESRSEG